MSAIWDVHGWGHLAVNNDPPLLAARKEFLEWLDEVPEPHRSDLESRLKSRLDHAHFSARLELYIHHYAISRGWPTTIHPDVPGTANHPDFLLEPDESPFLLECKSVLDAEAMAQQDQRLKRLADDLSRKMGITVILHPLHDLPGNLPVRRIRKEIEQQIHAQIEVQETEIWGDHQGERYGIKVLAFPDNQADDFQGGVEGLVSQAQTITTSQRIREQLQEKARKYGALGLPFVIAVSAETKFPARTENEVDAIFGDRVWNIHRTDGVSESRRADGLFTMTHDGRPRYSRVSAVLVYRFKWLEGGHDHRIHIYHNPNADLPLDQRIFASTPQFVPSTGTLMRWIGGEPASY